MKSKFFIAVVAVVCALAIFAGCQSNKPKEQASTPKEQPSATPPKEQVNTPNMGPFSSHPPEELPPVVTPPQPVELPPLEVTPAQPNDPSADVVKAAFEKMKLGNSPTFGLICRDWVMALYARDFDKAWGMYSANVRDQVEQQAESDVRGMNMMIRTNEAMLEAIKLPGKQEENIRNYIALLKDRLGKVRMMPNRKYHAYVFQEKERLTGKNPAEPFLTEGMEVIGEGIKGDKGIIATNLPAPNDKLRFVMENGVWKINFARVPRAPVEPPPSAEQNKP
jgi:hypothetical protein